MGLSNKKITYPQMQSKTASPLFLALLFASCASSRQEVSERVIQVYFVNQSLEAMDMKEQQGTPPPFILYPVERTIRSATPERAALEELVRGPTPEEVSLGYSSMLPGLTVSGFKIQDGVAVAEFNGDLRLGGLLAAPRLRQQVERTLLQFEAVESVSVRINGREDFDSLK